MPSSPVIVASQRENLVMRLSEAGIAVLGPVTTASMALTLAAQAPAALALVDGQLAGERTGAELAAQLYETWGVRSLVLDGVEPAAAAWAARPAEAERLRRALGEML